MSKAKVTVISERVSDKQRIIVADVEIGRKKERKIFSINRRLQNDDVKKYISEKIKKDIASEGSVIVKNSFEVEI